MALRRHASNKTESAFATKTERVASVLLSMALKAVPGAKLPTIRELCGSLAVSKATLAAALSEMEKKGVIERRHGSGLYATGAIHKGIGMVFGADIFGTGAAPVCRMLLDRSHSMVEERNFRFSFYFDLSGRSVSRPFAGRHDLLQDVRSGRVTGLLLLWCPNPEREAWLRTLGVPVVSLQGEIQLLPASASARGVVGLDYLEMIRLGIAALANRGRRRLALITPFGVLRPHDADRRAFAGTLASLGLDFRENRIWETALDRDYTAAGLTREHQGLQAAKALFAAGLPAPDGLVVLDDRMASGVLAGLQQLGLRLGRGLDVATHGNRGLPTLQGHEDALILLEVDPNEIAESMLAMLEAGMEGRAPAADVAIIKPQARICAPAAVRSVALPKRTLAEAAQRRVSKTRKVFPVTTTCTNRSKRRSRE